MPFMVDSEGAPLPHDNDGERTWDISVKPGLSPYVLLGVPMWFTTIPDDGHEGETYESCGVLTVPLYDLLEDIFDDFWQWDRGESLPPLICWLRTFADTLERELADAKAAELGAQS